MQDKRQDAQIALALARGVKGATPPLVPAHGWADSGSSPIGIPAGQTIVASVTVTPRVSGRFRVWITCAIDNNLGSTVAQITPGVGHNAGGVDYAPPNNGSETIPAGERGNVSLVVDLDQIPPPTQIFPVGTPVTIDAYILANTGTGTVCPAHNCQIAVQELPAP